MKLRNDARLIAWLAGIAIALMPSINPAHAQPQGQLLPLLQGVELTPSQQSQWQAIRQQTRQQIEQILRPEQVGALQTAMQQGQGWQTAIATANLTPAQKKQLRQVFQSARQQASGILTPTQQQQLRQNLKNQGWQRFSHR